MLIKKVEKALNDQLNAELYSSYLYLSMSAHFKAGNLEGFANWMFVQAQEELMHAMKFYDFITRRGGRVILQPVDAPPNEWASPKEAFEETLKHERKVTGLINNLVEIALSEHDHASNIFLQWFVTEQVEEEESANTVLQQLTFMGEAKGGLFMIDRELAQRTFTPPGVGAQTE
ncbi:MAG: ferritin [Deltaproteobacteria bacterium RBG_13_49_15]|nr:MAG: ferritin [Deltaproteobacteria bacterium RBG_13_49_15]